MTKPYIICHMVESLDGRIDCRMVDKISGDEYYSTLDSLCCPASVEGRVTMEHYYALPDKFDSGDSPTVDHEQWHTTSNRNDFHICPDTTGSLMWESATLDDGRPLLILTSEKATEKYLAYLRDKGISYIATGKDAIDLPRAMSILHDCFGVERLAVLGGGIINGGFLAAGLLDEVSMLIAPGIDGRDGMRASFDGISDTSKLPTSLSLLSVQREVNGVIWLRYKVN